MRLIAGLDCGWYLRVAELRRKRAQAAASCMKSEVRFCAIDGLVPTHDGAQWHHFEAGQEPLLAGFGTGFCRNLEFSCWGQRMGLNYNDVNCLLKWRGDRQGGAV